MRKAFVIGWPISHSKSPLLHRFWLDQYEIEGAYEAVAVAPDNFTTHMTNFADFGFVGGNITIPHKEAAFEFIRHKDEAANMIGAINTVWLDGETLRGTNTDAYGFSANLDDGFPRWRDGKTALVLGAGGASRAIIFALIEAGFTDIQIANRTLERAKELASRFGPKTSAHSLRAVPELLRDTDLLINTTSMGMEGVEATFPFDLSNLPASAIVTDIVYTPLQTPILKAAERLGVETVDGLGMLLHQAVPGFEKWFGRQPTVTPELRQHILDAL